MELLRQLADLAVLLVIAGGPLPLCFFMLAGPSSRWRGAAGAWLALLTAWCALELTIVLSLGLVGAYHLPFVVAGEVVLAVAGLALLARRGIPLADGVRALAIRAPLTTAERTVAASTALVGLVYLERLATRPILDFDSLWYHLPNMVVWYQKGSFAMMDTTGRPVIEQVLRYPYDWEALSSLFFFPFREDFFVAVPKLISWGMLGLAVHALSVRLGASRLHGLAAASLALTVPFVLFDLNTLRIDIPFAAFFLAGVWFSLSWAADRSPTDLALAFASLGLLAGTKMTGPVYAGLIAFAAIALRWRTTPPVEPRRAAGLVAGAIAFAALAGAFWYARNWIEVANPLGFVRIDVGGRTLLPGNITIDMIQRTSLARMFDVADPAHWKTLLTQVAARLQLPFGFLAAQALFLPRAFAVARAEGRRELLVATLFLTAVSGALFWAHTGTGAQGFSTRTVTPFVGQAFRYGFGFIGLVGVVAAVSATGMRTGPRWTVAAVLIGGVSGLLSGTLSEAIKAATFTGSGVEWASGLLHRLGSAPGRALGELVGALEGQRDDVVAPVLVWGIGTAMAVAAGPAGWRRLRATAGWRRVATVAVGAVLVVALLGAGRARRDASRDRFYGGVTRWISENVAPGETVGYAFSVYSYLFYGKDLTARVAYVPAASPIRAEWEERLAARGVQVVALGPSLGPRRSLEDLSADIAELDWLETTDSGWERVFGEDLSVTPWLWRREGRPAP